MACRIVVPGDWQCVLSSYFEVIIEDVGSMGGTCVLWSHGDYFTQPLLSRAVLARANVAMSDNRTGIAAFQGLRTWGRCVIGFLDPTDGREVVASGVQIEPDFSAETEFDACSAADATRPVALADFDHFTDVHAVVSRGGVMRLKKPHVVGTTASTLRIQRPHGMPPRPEGFLATVPFPAMTISRLSNAVCIPGGVALTAGGTKLLSESFGAYWSPQPHHSIAMTEAGSFRLRSPYTVKKRLTGKYFYLDSQHIAHYGHLLLDDLTRLWGYQLCMDVLGISDLRVITRCILPSSRAYLEGFGIAPENVEELTEPVICEELFVSTKSLQIQDYTSPITAPIFRRIRDAIDSRASDVKRLYISRRKTPFRRLTNEQQVEDIFRTKGFKIVYPQEFQSPESQVSIFAGAELLAGASGTNMFNLLFHRKLKSSFILCSPNLVHYTEAFLYQGTRSEMYYYLGELDENDRDFDVSDVNCPWYIARLDDLEAELDKWLERMD